MANTDKKQNDYYTRVPNVLLEALYSGNVHFSPIQFRVMLYVIRQTNGWGKGFADISVKRMAKIMKYDRASLSKTVKRLAEMGVLRVDHVSGKPSAISVNPIEKWGKNPVK